jgi:hypothetical protein
MPVLFGLIPGEWAVTRSGFFAAAAAVERKLKKGLTDAGANGTDGRRTRLAR